MAPGAPQEQQKLNRNTKAGYLILLPLSLEIIYE
jgi:hypothetical protein